MLCIMARMDNAISPTEFDSETHAFLQMRQTTRCFNELTRWFEKHPHFLLNKTLVPPGSSVNVNLLIQSSMYLDSIRDNGSMHVNARVRVYTPLVMHPLLSKETARVTGPQQVSLEHTTPLELHMADWPLITAHVASLYIAPGNRSFDHYFTESCLQSLGAAVERHFPNLTLPQLQNLKAAGLFEALDDNNAMRDAVRDLLFDSRQNEADLSLPNQLHF